MGTDLSQIPLRIRYPAGQFKDGRLWAAVDEARPMNLLNANLSTLFKYTAKDEQIPVPERARPRQETQAAALILAVNSTNPWKDQWISFWRDHFSVYGHDANVGAFLPHWEAKVIQRHAFGNFRQFLQATATHPCMLYYLNNKSSKAGNANENYARELFELHTLGRNAYLNNLYSKWRAVPGAQNGRPVGYIDQDVYEASRAFTGWTLEDGSALGGGQNLPKTGRFKYIESWHDNYQKRILAQEFDPYSGSMRDGQRVLDMCAFHPATAEHVVGKLVKRMISDDPPKSLIESTTRIFIQQQNATNQLAIVSQHLAHEAGRIPASQRKKVKNPMRLVASFAQAINLPFSLGEGKIMGPLESAGPSLYSWVSPEGPPDGMQWLLSAGYLRQRVALVQGMSENWWGTGEWDPFSGLRYAPTYLELLEHWSNALFGEPRPELYQAILLSQRIDPALSIRHPKEARQLVGYLAWAPSFQTETISPATALLG